MASWKVTVQNCYLLNVRKNANATSLIVAVVNKGYSTKATKSSKGFYYIDAKKGWVSGKYLKVVADKPAKKSNKKTVKKKTKSKTAAKKKTSSKKSKTYSTAAQRVVEKINATKELAKISKAAAKQKAGIINGYAPLDIKSTKVNNSGYKTMFDKSGKYVGKLDELHKPLPKKLYASVASLAAEEVNGDVEIYPMTMKENGYNSNIEDDGEDGMDVDWALGYAKKVVNALNNNDYNSLFSKMNRFKYPIPDYPLTKAIPYVFFSRPALRMYDSKGKFLSSLKGTYFDWMNNNHNKALKSLTNWLSTEHSLNPFLSNAVESFELSDEIISTVEHGETFTGHKNVYARNTNGSNTSGQFNIAYTEDKNLTIYTMHKAWIEYMHQMQRGYLLPATAYLHKKMIDYACSVYVILCSNDGESILYWAKYTGVFPLNTPSSAYSWTKGTGPSLPKFNINYSYAMKEEMNPLTMTEFNMLTNSLKSTNYREVFSSDQLMMVNGMVGMPFIEGLGERGSANNEFKLRFRNK